MVDAPDNLISQSSRRIDAKADRPPEDVDGIKVHLTAAEEGLSAVRRRIDRPGHPVTCVERKLDLFDQPH